MWDITLLPLLATATAQEVLVVRDVLARLLEEIQIFPPSIIVTALEVLRAQVMMLVDSWDVIIIPRLVTVTAPEV